MGGSMGSGQKALGPRIPGLLRNKRFIDGASTIIAALLGAGAIASYIIAIVRPHASVPFSVMGSLLTFCCGGVAGLAFWYGKLVRFEEYTPPRALAIGYADNFLVPVLQKLTDPAGGRPKPPKGKFFFVYVPRRLTESPQDQMDLFRKTIRDAGGYRCDRVLMDLADRTTRQLDAVVDEASGRVRFLDCPRTLGTLDDFIRYKMTSRGDSSDDEEREALERRYIGEFRTELEKLVTGERERRGAGLLREHVGILPPPGSADWRFETWLKEG